VSRCRTHRDPSPERSSPATEDQIQCRGHQSQNCPVQGGQERGSDVRGGGTGRLSSSGHPASSVTLGFPVPHKPA
ncbi:unnamed protein product, partial [Lepidochelys kempii]